MAIIIEEDRARAPLIPIAIWTIIVGIVVVAAYYLFFTQPQLIPIAPPTGFEDTATLASVNFDPQEVLDNPAFQTLRPYVTIASSSPSDFGRPNPFVSF